MKKITITAALAAVITVASPAVKADPFKGAYGGVQLGWQQNKLKSKDNNLRGTTADLKARGNTTTVPFGLHFGMSSCSTNNIYMAGEFGLDFTAKSTIKTITPYLAGKLGYRFHERVVAYAGAELNMTNYNLKRGVGNTKKTRFGYGPLAGVAFGLNDNMLLGLEYKYRMNGKIKYSALGTRTSYEAKAHSVMARASYKF